MPIGGIINAALDDAAHSATATESCAFMAARRTPADVSFARFLGFVPCATITAEIILYCGLVVEA
jgi:hypothetical protein